MMILKKSRNFLVAGMLGCLAVFGMASDVSYKLVGQWPGTLRGEYYDLKQGGEYLYASLNSQGVLAALPGGSVDLGVASYLNVGTPYCYGICIEGSTLYLGEPDGIQLVDISDPLNMKLGAKWQISYYKTDSETGEVSTTPSYYNILSIAKQGDLFYLAVGDLGFIVVDMSHPDAPVKLSEYDSDNSYPWRVELSEDGKTAFVGSMSDQVHIFDVSDPSNMTVIWHDATFFGNNMLVADIGLAGSYLYAPCYYNGNSYAYSSIGVADVSTPKAPSMAYTYPLAGYNFIRFSPMLGGAGYQAWTYFRTLDAKNRTRKWANLFDLSNPVSPYPVMEPISMDGIACSVAVKGHYAYVADDIKGVEILNISNPEQPLLMGTIGVDYYVNDIVVVGERLYIAAQIGGLFIYDVSDPLNPTQLGHCQSSLSIQETSEITAYGHVVDVAVEGDLVYMGVNIPTYVGVYYPNLFSSWGCVEVVNVADPSNIVFVGYNGAHGTCEHIEKYNDLVVIVGTGSYITTDVSNPASIGYMGTFTIPGGGGTDVVIPETTAPYGYVAAGTNGVFVLDFSDVANIGTVQTNFVTNVVVTLGQVELPGYAWGISDSEKELLVSTYMNGISRVDISSPREPKLLGTCELPGLTYGVAFSEDGKLILSANAELGSFIFQAEDIPVEQTSIKSWGYNGAGDFVMVLSLVSGNMAVEYSEDALTWKAESTAVIEDTHITIPASTFEGRKLCYFRIKQW